MADNLLGVPLLGRRVDETVRMADASSFRAVKGVRVSWETPPISPLRALSARSRSDSALDELIDHGHDEVVAHGLGGVAFDFPLGELIDHPVRGDGELARSRRWLPCPERAVGCPRPRP
jgi:hypothetical protein